MAVVTIYETAGGTWENPDIWSSYRLASVPGTLPLNCLVKVTPEVTPPTSWNLLGYACTVVRIQGVVCIGESTAISARAVTDYQSLSSDGLALSPSRISGFLGVDWHISRWIGRFRIQLVYIN